jgi:hypothetical protein
MQLALQGVEIASHPNAHNSESPTGEMRAYYAPLRDAQGDVAGALVIVTTGSSARRPAGAARANASAA